MNLIIAVLLLRIFFLSPTPEAYNKFLPYLAGLYVVDSFFLVALYRTIQSRKAGLGAIKN